MLVIGSNGQDGSILCDLLDADNQAYIAVSRSETRLPDKTTRGPVDLSIPKEATKFLDEFKPSSIVHLAAVHAPSGSMYEAGEFMYDEMFKCHVQITKNVLEWQLNNPESKSMIALSSQMYSSQKQDPFIKLDSPINPSSKYGETKAESWNLIKSYRAQYGVKTIGLILFNHTSSWSKPNFLFPELANQFHNILNGAEAIVKIRDTEAYIDIFSAHELGEALISCIKIKSYHDIIFSSGHYEKISDVIRNCAEILAIPDRLELVSTLPTDRGVPLHGDISKTYDLLRWKPKATPSEILASMVWDLQNDN